MRWRTKIAEAADFPPLGLMEGFYQRESWAAGARNSFEVEQVMKRLPLSWEKYCGEDPLVKLLYHSDCEGSLDAEDCGPIADRLTELLPLLEGDEGGHIGNLRQKTETFIAGLRPGYKLVGAFYFCISCIGGSLGCRGSLPVLSPFLAECLRTRAVELNGALGVAACGFGIISDTIALSGQIGRGAHHPNLRTVAGQGRLCRLTQARRRQCF
jgi:hypothetical protein